MDLEDGLITSYFQKAKNKTNARSVSSKRKRRPSNNVDEFDSSSTTTPAKRSKSKAQAKSTAQPGRPRISLDFMEEPTQTPGAGSSKDRTFDRPEIIDISSDEPQHSRKFTAVTKPPRTGPSNLFVLTSRLRYSPVASSPLTSPIEITAGSESMVPATPDPQHGPPSPESPLTPLPSEYEALEEVETVGSSQSQEIDTPHSHASITLHRATFDFSGLSATPRNSSPDLLSSDDEDSVDREGSSCVESPRFIASSQSQYLSASQISPRSLFRRRSTMILDTDLVPSSQSQEKELELDIRNSYARTNRQSKLRDETPELSSRSLSSAPSFSKELPVRQLSLGEAKESSDPGDTGTPSQSSLPESEQHDQDCGGSYSQSPPPASFPYHDFPQPDSFPPSSQLKSPSPIPQGQQHPYDGDLDEGDSQVLSDFDSTPTPHATREETQESLHSVPPEVKAFHSMFAGDESYPPDFPMSLRV